MAGVDDHTVDPLGVLQLRAAQKDLVRPDRYHIAWRSETVVRTPGKERGAERIVQGSLRFAIDSKVASEFVQMLIGILALDLGSELSQMMTVDQIAQLRHALKHQTPII